MSADGGAYGTNVLINKPIDKTPKNQAPSFSIHKQPTFKKVLSKRKKDLYRPKSTLVRINNYSPQVNYQNACVCDNNQALELSKQSNFELN